MLQMVMKVKNLYYPKIKSLRNKKITSHRSFKRMNLNLKGQKALQISNNHIHIMNLDASVRDGDDKHH